MPDSPLAKIESDIRGFVRASYPDMIVHAEHWKEDPSRIALFCIDEHFEGLYPRQRYHYLVHLIPTDYFDAFLADTVWFELTPGQRPEDVEEDPDQDLIGSITPNVLRSLEVKGFFARLDDIFCPMNGTTPPEKCPGDFRHAKNTLSHCGFDESDWSDVFHVLMGQGAFCDCEILYNADVENRLKTQYWQSRAHETRQNLRGRNGRHGS